MDKVLFFLHIMGLVMGIPSLFGFLYLRIASAKMSSEEAARLTKDILPVKKLGYVGLAFMIITGIIMINPYWTALGSMPMLLAKLILVVFLIPMLVLLSIYSKKINQADNPKYLTWIKIFSGLSLIITIAIILLAVLSWH